MTFLISFFLISVIQLMLGVDFAVRAGTLTSFSMIVKVVIIFVILRLPSDIYKFEKSLLITCLSVTLIPNAFWLYYGFEFPSENLWLYSINGLGFVKLFEVLCAVGLILLSIAWTTAQYKNENKRYKVIRNSLNLALKNAEYANADKNNFLENIGLEFRKNLKNVEHVVHEFTSGKNGMLDTDQKSSLKNITTATQYLYIKIDELIDVASSGRRGFKTKISRISLNDFFELAMPLLLEVGVHKKNKIELDYNSLEPEKVFLRIDEMKLKQILIHLVSNAVKYSPPQGLIKITCHKNETLRINIIGQGIGIIDDQDKTLFADTDTKSNSMHGQIGENDKAYTKKMIKAMNGKVGYESVLGDGTTFWIELPFIMEDQNVW
ncbi:MAG: ATP-binding protein [Emcibacteraceae bacterium]|nr:ATP-binding protein [Emcibacteraceae bacterium]